MHGSTKPASLHEEKGLSTDSSSTSDGERKSVREVRSHGHKIDLAELTGRPRYAPGKVGFKDRVAEERRRSYADHRESVAPVSS